MHKHTFSRNTNCWFCASCDGFGQTTMSYVCMLGTHKRDIAAGRKKAKVLTKPRELDEAHLCQSSMLCDAKRSKRILTKVPLFGCRGGSGGGRVMISVTFP